MQQLSDWPASSALALDHAQPITQQNSSNHWVLQSGDTAALHWTPHIASFGYTYSQKLALAVVMYICPAPQAPLSRAQAEIAVVDHRA